MSIFKSVDSPEKLLLCALLGSAVLVFVLQTTTTSLTAFSPSPVAPKVIDSNKNQPEPLVLGPLRFGRNPFILIKQRHPPALAALSPLASLDVRGIRLVGTLVDKGAQLAWVRPLNNRLPPLRVGLHESVGQEGWYVAAIGRKALYLRKNTHGKVRKMVLRLDNV